MGSTSSGANVYLGRGRVYLDRLDASGNRTGWRHVGDATKVEISQNPETVQLKDYAQSTAPILQRNVISNEINIAVTLKEWVKENLALALLGTESTYTQTSSSVTGETLTTASAKDRHYKTAFRQISAVTVRQSATVLVAGTDYDVVDANVGLIYIRPTSVTVTPGSTITIDYTRAAITTALDKIIGGQSTSINCALLYVGDPATGPSWDYEFWKVNIAPDGALALIGDDYGEITLKGLVLADAANHPTEPNFTAIRKS